VLFPEAFLQRVQLTASASPSMVVTAEPSACTAKTVHDFDAAAVEEHGAGAALAGVAPDVRAGEQQVLAQEVDEQQCAVRPAPCAPCR
jgi:hypothetical protein